VCTLISVSVSQELCFCTQLRELHLRKNSIVNLQGNIYQWTQLVIVDLGENNLQFCPIEIGRLPELQEVMLDGNAKLRIPPQV
jgi:Leucine-rich repeat (LRR) protein